MRRISVIGATYSGNRGGEAMLTTTLGRLGELVPDATFSVYSYYPGDDRRFSRERAVVYSATPAYLVFVLFPCSLILGLLRMLRLGGLSAVFPAAVRDLMHSDVLVDLAGVSFIDGREKFLPFNVLTILPAMLLGVPVVKLSQALGPFGNPLNRALAGAVLPRCARVFARGDRTRDNLAGLGLRPPVLAEACDVAFSFSPADAPVENPEHAAELRAALDATRAAGRIVFGVCPSSVVAAKARGAGWDYPALLAEVVRAMHARGASVLLFPNATRESSGAKLRNNDLPVIAQVAALLPEEVATGTVVVRHDLDAGAIRTLVERCDAAMVSRFHAMVGALEAAVPVMVLGWSHKYLEVMEQFGLGEHVFDHAEHRSGPVVEAALGLLERREEVAAAIRVRLPEVKRSSRAQFEQVASLVGVPTEG